MRRILVENVMTSNIVEVASGCTVRDAAETMRQRNVGKIIVTGPDKKTHKVLEAWKVTESDLKLKVNQLPLTDLKTVPLGTAISDIQHDLVQRPAVGVVDPKSGELVGILTAHDAATRA